MIKVPVKTFKGIEKDKESGEVVATYSRAKMPERKHPNTDSGADAFVCWKDGDPENKTVVVYPGQTVKGIPLGISCEIPDGYEIQLRPRSGIGGEGRIAVYGTIDNAYRGVMKCSLSNISDEPFIVHHGDRICQLVLAPVILGVFEEAGVDETISDSDRGADGFGSTGING